MNNEIETPEMTQAEKIQAARQEPLFCTSGNVYMIRAVSPLDFYGTSGLPEGRTPGDDAVQTEAELEAALTEDIKKNWREYVSLIMARGTVKAKVEVDGKIIETPKIVSTKEADTAANFLSMYDLSKDDFLEILNAVERISNMELSKVIQKKTDGQ